MDNPTNPTGPKVPGSGESKQELHESELVAKLVPDPSQQQPVTSLTGYLGRSTQAGHWRLYLTPALDEYLEISEQNIVHSQPLGSDQSSSGAVTVWVQSDAPLRYTRVTSRQVQAEFLQGSLAKGFTSQAPALGARKYSGLRPWIHGYGSQNLCLSDLCSMDRPIVCKGGGGSGGGGQDTSDCAPDF